MIMTDFSIKNILVTGALGQIGSELCSKLAEIYGKNRVIASDIKAIEEVHTDAGSYLQLDVCDFEKLELNITNHNVGIVYHLAALLSGTSEKNPLFAWKLNTDTLVFLCEMAKDKKINQIFWPSSIAVFGKGIPKENVAQDVVLNPTTVYGISKMAGEKWCEYYHDKYGVDIRSIRYPGLISWKTPAGGGTTDYAVEIFHKAVKENKYCSYIAENTAMPMLYMDDAIDATLQLMQTSAEKLSIWNSYNLGGMSFTPKELAHEIKALKPDFEISYAPDFRQEIADSWPASINDSLSKKDWGLHYRYDMKRMTQVMLDNLQKKQTT